ncbi:MAG TPA: ABC transporter ATP-binding protein [Acidimicrobiales bacterium]
MAQDRQRPMEGVTRKGVRLLVRYVRADPRPFLVSIVGATVYAAAAVSLTIALGWITDEVIVPSFESGRVSGRTVLGAGGLLLGVGLLRAGTVALRRFYAATLAFRTAAAWRRRLTETYLEVPLDYHRRTPTGQLLAHADNDILAATEVLNPLPFSIGVLTLVVFAVISLATVDWLLMVVALLLFPALALVNRAYTSRIAGPLAQIQHEVGNVSRVAHESFDGALVVKTLGRAPQEVERLDAAAAGLQDARVGVGRIRGAFEPLIDVIPNTGIIVLLLIGSWQVSVGRLGTGEVVQAAALFSLLAFPMRIFGFFLQELPRSVVAAARLDEVVANEREAPPGQATVDLPSGPLAIELRHVTHRHGDDPPVLDDLDLEVPAGSVVALVGATGAGKSSLCELLPRLVDPETGSVRIGGVDVRELDPEVVRQAVALVFQESFLFADSIRENVTLGDPVDPAALETAAGIAHAQSFVEALPEGWDTVVGERGVTLSGGQRQRLALTRALLRRPRVLVLDDATSAVDPVVEAGILSDLRAALSTTTLVVAHRISTIELADRVAFLADGRIVNQGAHSELLDRDPAYRRLVRAYAEAGER